MSNCVLASHRIGNFRIYPSANSRLCALISSMLTCTYTHGPSEIMIHQTLPLPGVEATYSKPPLAPIEHQHNIRPITALSVRLVTFSNIRTEGRIGRSKQANLRARASAASYQISDVH